MKFYHRVLLVVSLIVYTISGQAAQTKEQCITSCNNVPPSAKCGEDETAQACSARHARECIAENKCNALQTKEQCITSCNNVPPSAKCGEDETAQACSARHASECIAKNKCNANH